MISLLVMEAFTLAAAALDTLSLLQVIRVTVTVCPQILLNIVHLAMTWKILIKLFPTEAADRPENFIAARKLLSSFMNYFIGN